MRSKIIIGISFVLLLIGVSCIRPSPYPTTISFHIHLYYQSKNGADLLNPQTQGSFNINSVKVVDLTTVNGKPTETPSLVAPQNPICSSYGCPPDNNNTNNSSLYFIQFALSTGTAATFVERKTLVQLNASVTDTLSYELTPPSATSGYYRVNKILYKNQVLWSLSSPVKDAIVVTIVR